MFQTGSPIGTEPDSSTAAAAGSAHEVTSTDASVGPYRLCTTSPSTRAAATATSGESASPLHSTRRSEGPAPAAAGSATKAASIDGTKWTVVTPASRMMSAR